MKTMRINFLLYLLVVLMPLFGQETSTLHKKEAKAIQRSFGENSIIEYLQPALENDSLKNLLYPEDCLYKVTSGNEIQAYLFSTRAKGRYDYFDYFILYSKDLTVKEVIVTVYRSSHGAAICQEKWLSQFSGYRGGVLKLGTDIDGVSGGTLSAYSIVKDLQRCQLFMSGFLKTD
jgi:hypothetical protein